jgi:hypothetical protein
MLIAMSLTVFLSSLLLSLPLIGDLSTIPHRPPRYLSDSADAYFFAAGSALALFFLSMTVVLVARRRATWWLIPLVAPPTLLGIFVGLHVRLQTATVVGASPAAGLTTILLLPVGSFLTVTSLALIAAAVKTLELRSGKEVKD